MTNQIRCRTRSSRSAYSNAILCWALASLAAGCGGGSSSTSSSPGGPQPAVPATTAVQIQMGDAPADWMLAFSMNIASMALTGSNGSKTVVSSPVAMEMMHLMGMMQPLAVVAIPQGSWTGASITIASATVMYMDPLSRTVVQKTIAGPMSSNLTFSAPMNLGSTPMVLGFDLDLEHSVTTDSSGSLTMNPVFHMTMGAQGAGNPADFSDGGMRQMMGVISGVSGGTFTMTCLQASQPLTFTTSGSTVFDGTSMGGISGGMLVMVDAALQADGTLLATRVDSMMGAGGMMGGGIVTAVTGEPPTELTMVLQNGAGAGMMGSNFASGATVTLNGSTSYAIDHDDVDLSNLPFTPAFDPSHIFAGQSVMPVSAGGMMSGATGGGMMGGGMMGGSLTASTLELTQQGLGGIMDGPVSSGSTASFTLQLPPDCAFRSLAGASSVTVYQQAKTLVAGTAPIAAGTAVHAYGLLFYDGGQWKMVASRIAAS